MTNPEFQNWTVEVQGRVETALSRHLPNPERAPQRLHSAMRYAVLGGGKRVRPLLVFAAGVAAGAAPEHLEAAACAVEYIHTYSLVHDDLPCMDNDALRRGRATVHVQFDEATAMLAGDALQSLAFEVLAQSPIADAACHVRMLHLLAQASGAPGMAGGQAIDLDCTGKAQTLPELEYMHILKTGALIRAAVLLGAWCGRLDTADFERLDRYAKCVGLAFQVVDDVLDAESDTETLGKTAGKDAEQGKSTYVGLLGIADAKQRAEELRTEAHAALAGMAEESARHLHSLADFIVLRRF